MCKLINYIIDETAGWVEQVIGSGIAHTLSYLISAIGHNM